MNSTDILTWIDNRQPLMRQQVEQWAAVNSGTFNRAGVNRVGEAVAESAESLQADIRQVSVPDFETIDDTGRPRRTPLGNAVVIHKRPDAPVQAMLAIHLDTVYAEDDPFQSVTETDANTITGPGVADAKGGIAVMLTALAALEQSEHKARLGYRVVLNPDEEIGSPGSADLLAREAAHCQVGLVFEPALPDGSLIGQRKGSGNFTLVVKGRAAHAGRDFHLGRSAVHALADVIVQLKALNTASVTVNVGRVGGGGPVNRVADLAIAHFNVRVESDEHQVTAQIDNIIKTVNEQDGITASLTGSFAAPPKPLDERTHALLQQIADCGDALGVPIQWQSSGGVCDGNRLAAAGLPTVDTLGPRGGKLHSPNEYLCLDSLAERAKLTTLLLLRYASGEISPPPRGHA